MNNNSLTLENFNANDIPKEDLQALGLYKDEKINLPEETLNRLLKGELTDFVKLENININGSENISLDAKLSLNKKETGEVALLIHPIYNDIKIPKELNSQDVDKAMKEGLINKPVYSYGKLVDFGVAPYENIKTNKDSFFVELEKFSGDRVKVWGVELEKALAISNFKKGDNIQLVNKGNEAVKVQAPVLGDKNEIIRYEDKIAHKNLWEITALNERTKKEKFLLFEFDKETKSFVGVNPNQLKIPIEINGTPLTEKNKKDLKDGKVVDLENDTQIQISSTEKNQIRSNKNLLVASMLLDGGISYLLYTGISALINESKLEKQKETSYSHGYMEALKKVQNDLERKATTYPNDKTIQNDLSNLKNEMDRFSSASKISPIEASVKSVLEKVDDPELGANLKEKADETIQNREEIKIKTDEKSESKDQVNSKEFLQTTEKTVTEEKTQSSYLRR
jgi:hypothetical protein